MDLKRMTIQGSFYGGSKGGGPKGVKSAKENCWSKLIGAKGAREDFWSTKGLEEKLAQSLGGGGVQGVWVDGGPPPHPPVVPSC